MKYQAIETCGGNGGMVPVYLIAALGCTADQLHDLVALPSGKSVPGTHWVGPIARLVKGKVVPVLN
jgi:hypothetical protein